MILDTDTKTWIDPIPLTNVEDDVIFKYEGAASQISSDKTFVYFFGGMYMESGAKYITSRLRVLNLNNNKWLCLNMYKDDNYVQERSYASLAIIKNRYLVAGFGTLSSWTSSEFSNIDIFELKGNGGIISDLVVKPNAVAVALTLVMSLSHTVHPAKLSNPMNSSTIMLIAYIVFFASCVTFIVAIIVNRKRLRQKNNWLTHFVFRVIWTRR